MERLKNQAVERLKEELTADPPLHPPEEPADQGRLYAFFSFDLVNATAFKAANPGEWPLVIQKFYEFSQDQLCRKYLSAARRWKFVGDEVLFYMRLRSREDLRQLLEKTNLALQATIKFLHELSPDTKTLLSVKACVWCAHVEELPPGPLSGAEARPRNIVVRNPLEGASGYQIDFLGPDIDIGFRISRYSAARRLVIGSDLAYLLYRDRGEQKGDVERGLRIVDFQRLKGVWDNRHHPIVWYEPSWDGIEDSFPYDAPFNDAIAARILEGQIQSVERLEKVYDDLDDRKRVDDLWSELPATSDPSWSEDEVAADLYLHALEVHCVAVCIRPDGQVLIAKRLEQKERLAGAWEFGCGQLQYGETFPEAISRSYQSDFNARLDFGPDPITVRIYDIDAETRIPGVIVVAEIVNPEEVVANKHQEIQWIAGTDDDRRRLDPTVPDFWTTFDVARERWREWREGGAAAAAS